VWPIEPVSSSPGDAGRDSARDAPLPDLPSCAWSIANDFEQPLPAGSTSTFATCSPITAISIEAVNGHLAIRPGINEPEFCYAVYTQPALTSCADLTGGRVTVENDRNVLLQTREHIRES
jgi:hypothetical protein